MSRREASGSGALLDRGLALVIDGGARGAALWLTGTAPFLAGLLFAGLRLRTRPTADVELAALALALSALYLWMKTWHVQFGLHLRSTATAVAPPRIELKPWLRHAAVQLRFQPFSFLVLPLAFLLLLPFGWAYAYFMSISVTGDSTDAARHCRARPRENHQLLLTYHPLLMLLFVNVFVSLVLLPSLAQTLLGIETSLSRSVVALFNSTTVSAAAAITYLLGAPVVRAAYVVRGLESDSESSAEDLLAELATLRSETG